LLRKAFLPLCLLLCVNPVPRAFNTHFDMPLQQLSASTARAFAHMIGLHPTGAQLRMMFSPDFGMMIVPGCNGIRGSITLAYLALIYGYIRRLKPERLAMVGLGSLFAGYLFNLLRLCVLVVYYRIGLSVPSIQSYGAGVDYAIGCTIFLVATIGLGFLVRALAPAADTVPAEPVVVAHRFSNRGPAVLRVLCLLVLTLIPISRAKSMLTAALARPEQAQQLLQSLPQTVGPYRLVRTYSEQQYGVGGASLPTFLLGDYVADGSTNRITLALYLVGYHRVIDSKSIEGLHPESTGSFQVQMPSAAPVPFGVSVYNDGEMRQFNAESICDEKRCADPSLDYESFHASDYVNNVSSKHLPILLRREWPDNNPAPPAVLLASFEHDAQAFVQGLNVPLLVERLGKPLY
jgi:exosortase J